MEDESSNVAAESVTKEEGDPIRSLEEGGAFQDTETLKAALPSSDENPECINSSDQDEAGSRVKVTYLLRDLNKKMTYHWRAEFADYIDQNSIQV